jgi:Na+/H+ antiporter NhaA
MELCKKRDIFGKPREGAHAIRIPILDLALVDVALTIVVVIAISYFFKVSILKVSLATIIITIVIHRLFCVNTRVNTLIFGNV